uniref:Odorant binding protein 3 n=1 Tax=Colaphellus bowringi TaxID=561076 RepID=A0A0S3J375_9CUCU|nr:odorant binding protein 3 [Colaphellus bowringi]
MRAAKGDYQDDMKLKKQILCFNKKVGLQDENGDIVLDVAKSKLFDIVKDEKKTMDILKKCAVKKDTPENTAFESAKCLHKLAPEEKLVI